MKKEKNVQLTYLMDLLKVSGQKLADEIKVDRTLISKWKSGSRPFNPSIAYFQPVIDTFIKINDLQKARLLEQFFEKIYPSLNKNQADYLTIALTMWLSGNPGEIEVTTRNTDNHILYKATIDLYKGNSGKRHAIINFFEKIKDLPADQELYLSDMADLSWMIESKEFMEIWKREMSALLIKGHKVSIIHNTSRSIDNISEIVFNWLPLYFTGNLKSYYYHNIDTNISAPTVYILKDQLALLSMSSTTGHKNRYTALYSDPFSISHMKNVFENRLQVSNPLVDLYSFNPESIENLTYRLIELGKKIESSYVLTPIPLFTTMSQETLIRVLNENNLNEKSMERILNIHKGIQDLFFRDIEKYSIRQFYDLDILNQYANMDEVIYLEPSVLASKPIKVSKELFKEHITSLIEKINTFDNFKVALIPFNKMESPEKVTIWVKQNCFVYSYPQFQGQKLTLSDEYMTINGFFAKLNDIWEKMPLINKNQDWVLEQLQKAIK